MAKTYRKNRMEVIGLCEEYEMDRLHFIAIMVNEFWLDLIGVKTERQFKWGWNPFKWYQDVPVQGKSEAFYELCDKFYAPDQDIAELLERAKASKAKTITLTEDEWLDLYGEPEDFSEEFEKAV